MKQPSSEHKKNIPTANNKSKQKSPTGESLFDLMDSYLSRNYKWLIWAFPVLALLFSLLLFDQRISQAGDDSFYIIRAYDFIHSFKYPSFQGPLYPMVLGLVVAVFGISLIPLKMVSLISMLLFIYIVFKILKDRIPPTILVATMMVISVNGYLLYYSSQTYNEAFYLFLQSILLLVFFSRFIDVDRAENFPAEIKRHLLLACCLLAITLNKNIGFSAIIAVSGYFVLKGQWKNLLYAVIAFGAVFALYQGIRFALWREGGLQFSSQASGLLNKDYYNPQLGKEDLAGMIKRFMDNSQLYLSKHFLYMIGLRTYSVALPVSAFATFCVYLLALAGLVITYKRNAYIFFIGLLSGAFLLVTFVILQAKWDQGRLIIPAISFLLLLIFSAFYYLSKLKKLRYFQILLPFIAFILFFSTLAATASQVKKAREETGRYGGLTPDWKHYIQASEWAAENLPKDAVIACRKPSISFVYGKGRNFYGIMQIPSFSLDQFYSDWKKNPHNQVAFLYSDFAGKPLPPGMFDVLKKNMIAQYFIGDKFYFIDRLPDSVMNKTIDAAKAMGITGDVTGETLKEVTRLEHKAGLIIYPDSLLNLLVTNKVSHVITASLRRNSLEKTGQTINTVERYIAFIEDKYPGFMNKITQIGSDDNEPASIIQLDYGKTGRTIKK